MVSVETVVGEFGLCSSLLCEEVLEVVEASVEVMVTVLVSLLLSSITIMVVMYYFRLSMAMVLLSIS
jgi:hypothetical protein